MPVANLRQRGFGKGRHVGPRLSVGAGSNLDNFCTPPEVADLLEEFFEGPVDLDPCSNANSIILALRTYTAGALHLPWYVEGRNETGYENPPYSKLDLFTDKATLEASFGLELVRLVPVATSTAWWRSACAPNPRLAFTRRLAFIDPRKPHAKREGARFDSVLQYYGRRRARFDKVFAPVTSWTSWGNA